MGWVLGILLILVLCLIVLVGDNPREPDVPLPKDDDDGGH